MSTTEATEHRSIAIVGSGLSGVGMAIALRREGNEDFVILERAGDLGGTWRDNTYPGCACDIPSVLYSYADEPNPEWTRGFALQAEIQSYIRAVAAEHDIDRFIRYGHELTSAAWDDERERWRIETTAGALTADVLVSAAGALADPRVPELPGLQTFAGTTFHSARWDHDHALAGRRVAVVGTGASAIQFVPEIQPEVGHLTLFQRTPTWVMPRDNPFIAASARRAFGRFPWLQRLLRELVFDVQEGTHIGFGHPIVMRAAQLVGRAQIARQVSDRGLRRRLTPTFSLGCKRVLFSNRWYPAITADNAEVVTAGIREVVPEGIVDADGVLHEVDTIVFGTGFHVTDVPIAQRIRGQQGELLSEVWDGSPRAHLGIGVHGFPNLFFLLGPGTGLGHNSVIVMIEAQIAYLRRLLAHRARWGYRAAQPTAAAQGRYVSELDRGNEGSVWTAGGCASWYVDANGRQTTLWPLSVRAYQRRLARFDPGDWETVPDRAPGAGDEPAAQPALA